MWVVINKSFQNFQKNPSNCFMNCTCLILTLTLVTSTKRLRLRPWVVQRNCDTYPNLHLIFLWINYYSCMSWVEIFQLKLRKVNFLLKLQLMLYDADTVDRVEYVFSNYVSGTAFKDKLCVTLFLENTTFRRT